MQRAIRLVQGVLERWLEQQKPALCHGAAARTSSWQNPALALSAPVSSLDCIVLSLAAFLHNAATCCTGQNYPAKSAREGDQTIRLQRRALPNRDCHVFQGPAAVFWPK